MESCWRICSGVKRSWVPSTHVLIQPLLLVCLVPPPPPPTSSVPTLSLDWAGAEVERYSQKSQRDGACHRNRVPTAAGG